MTILAIDPSSKNLGWAILDEAAVIKAGLIQSGQEDTGFRFLEMMETFLPVFDLAVKHDVRIVIIEEYMNKSMKGTNAVKGMIGVIQYIIAKKGFKASFIYPIQVKSMVAGNGRAEKHEVAAAVHREYPFSSRQYTNHNVTDAIAIGIAAFKRMEQEEETIKKVMELAETNDGKLSSTIIYGSNLVKTKKEAGYMLAILKSRYECDSKNKRIFKLPWQSI